MPEYTKTEWEDEVLAGAERFEVLDNAGDPVDDVGDLTNCQITLKTAIISAGTPVNAANLNNLEDAVEALANDAYHYVQTLYITSTENFEKGDYPWLRALRVRCQAGGGGGGGTGTTSVGENAEGAGGGGGGYAEKFINDIAGLDASVTCTVGAGGTGSANGITAGQAGGNTSFGALVVATGGSGGSGGPATNAGSRIEGGCGGSGTAGDFIVAGDAGGSGNVSGGNRGNNSFGGGSMLGGLTRAAEDKAGYNGGNYGAGGGGASNSPQTGARSGGTGGPGIIILDLFA